MKAQTKLKDSTSSHTGTTEGKLVTRPRAKAATKLARKKISPAQVSKQQIATLQEIEEAINFAGLRLRTLGSDYERLAWLLEDVLAQIYATRDEEREQFTFDDLPEHLFKVG